MLIANKDRFVYILETKNQTQYDELSRITGLAWHPTQNGIGTEKLYIEFIEVFLTSYFEEAKRNGDEALVHYFYAFQGVCFEDRARNLEEYAAAHPLEGEMVFNDVADWSTEDKVEDVFMKEATVLALNSDGAPPTPTQLLERLNKQGIFDREFRTSDGTKSKPTVAGYNDWAKEQIEMCILSEEENDDANEIGGQVNGM
jgi:hypothetical protein